MSYPEKIPSTNLKNFTFSFNSLSDAKNDISSQYEALDARISNIVESEKFHIEGFPVLKHIFVLNPKKSDLKKLSKALDRLADLVDIYDGLKNKLSLIEAVQNDPNWFAWTFGDYSKDIDTDLELLLNDNDN